jgi:hypothetical protein
MAESLRFTAKPKEQPFDFEGLDGVVRQYKIKELLGDSRDQYLNLMKSRMEIGPDGKEKVKDHRGLLGELLARSIFDENDKLIPLVTIQSWPNTTQMGLFKASTELSSLGEKDVEKAGNA